MTVAALSAHKRAVRDHFNGLAGRIDAWRRKSWYYHRELERFCRSAIPAGSSVLEIGCGTGELLAALEPREGLGIDLSPEMIRLARERFPELEWRVADAESMTIGRRFDYVVMSDLLGHLEDIWAAFQELKTVTHPSTRVVITYYNFLWEPILRLAERVGQRTPLRLQNWLSVEDIENLLALCDFEVVRRGYRFYLPKHVPGVSWLVNRLLPMIPFMSRLGLIEYVVARPRVVEPVPRTADPTFSVIVPCRDERGNIAAAVERIPDLGASTEIVFVEGGSTDGTREEIERQIASHPEKQIRLVIQDPPGGKGNAVRSGFDEAKGDILMILDADLTVAPEDLPKFGRAIVEAKGELINGTRLVYPMERQAMRFLNLIGNRVFSFLFSWILEQRITDTLCGTKVLRRRDYERIKANRAYFGDFDPFGDFDLLFGAAKLNLKITELPIRYRERSYGETKISRFRHGLLLLRMSWIAFRKLKAG